MRDNLIIIVVVGAIVLTIVAQSRSQELPDAPSARVNPVPAWGVPPKQTGWTRWDGQQAQTNRQILRDKKFQWFTAGLVAATVLDIETTHAGLARHNCVEANPRFGMHPSRGELYLHNGLEDAGVIGLGFLMEKMLPADRAHWGKAEKVAQWIYPAMATYGIQLHVRGAVSWYSQCW